MFVLSKIIAVLLFWFYFENLHWTSSSIWQILWCCQFLWHFGCCLEDKCFESENDLVLFYDCIQATHGWYFILGQIGHLGYMSSIWKVFLSSIVGISVSSRIILAALHRYFEKSFEIHPFKADQSVIHKASVGAHLIWIVRSNDFHLQILIFKTSIGDKYTAHGNRCTSIFNHFWVVLKV
jgi:hypothetical protein